MDNNKNHWIPRNLDDSQVLKLGWGINLKSSDIPILLSSGLLSYFLTNNFRNITFKVIVYILIVGGSYLVSKFKIIEDQDIKESSINSIIYTKNKINYSKRRKEHGVSKKKGLYLTNSKIDNN